MRKYAVIVAGGSGQRMGNVLPKQFMLLRGKPVLSYSIDSFLTAFSDLEIILVLPEKYLDTGKAIIADSRDPGRVWMTEGGETRFHSVKNGLSHIQEHSMVFIHDGVRCLLTPALIQRCYEMATRFGHAIPAIAAVDSIRIETLGRNEIVDRSKVRLIQTPQTFYSELIKGAFEQDYDPSFTDEASVVERLGVKIQLVEGEETNIKITKPMDLLVAEKILEERSLQ